MEVAERLGAHILSVDSMQVYRGMDIGTAKPSKQDQLRVVHHMIDLVEPEAPYSVAEFQAAARTVIENVETSVVIAGGSGLHFRGVVDPLEFPPTDAALRANLDDLDLADAQQRLLELDPDASSHVDMANPRRVVRAIEIAELTGETPSARASSPQARRVAEYEPELDFVAFGLDPAAALEERVAARLKDMRAGGFLDEVESIADRLGPTAANAVGYRQLLPVVRGERSEQEGFSDAQRATMALAKRQRTFFRRDPRIRWLPWHDEPDRRLSEANSVLEEVAAWTS